MISRHVSEMTTILIVEFHFFFVSVSLVSFSFVSSILCSSLLSTSMTVISIINMAYDGKACYGLDLHSPPEPPFKTLITLLPVTFSQLGPQLGVGCGKSLVL